MVLGREGLKSRREGKMIDLVGIRRKTLLLSFVFAFVWQQVNSLGLTEEKVQTDKELPGFLDTPMQPDGIWRVHDAIRPRPPIVIPGLSGESVSPPSDAVILFDGTDLSHWLAEGKGSEKGKLLEPQWKVEKGYMEIVPETGTLVSRQTFGDCQIHIEWATPSEVRGSSQGRGNSGILIMGKYEIQVLDSFQNLSYADGQAAAIYGQYPPLVNASRGPGVWQVYDIIFEAPHFKDGLLQKPAYVTVLHNGIVVHHRKAFIGAMRYREVAVYKNHERKGPLKLQAHKNLVRYRNIWVRPLGTYDHP
jgi:hypothetical protein